MNPLNSKFTDPRLESDYINYLMRVKYKLYETEDELNTRKMAISSLETLIDEWQLDMYQ